MTADPHNSRRLRLGWAGLRHGLAVFTTGTLLLAATLTQVVAFPLYERFVASQDGTVPWPARMGAEALHPVVLGLLALGLLVYAWWQQPAIQARGIAPWLRRWPLLPTVNLYLIAAIIGESNAVFDFMEWGFKDIGVTARMANAGHPRIVKRAAEIDRFDLLSDSATWSYLGGDLATARKEAEAALDAAPQFTGDERFGHAIHDGNMVLGLIALRNGDRPEAIRRLMAAGKSPGSPFLNFSGPNMSLARDLLLVGERRAVLDYFTEIRAFWHDPYQLLPQWEADIRRGAIPRFGSGRLFPPLKADVQRGTLPLLGRHLVN